MCGRRDGPGVGAVVQRVAVGTERVGLRVFVVLDTTIIGDAIVDEIGGQMGVGAGYEGKETVWRHYYYYYYYFYHHWQCIIIVVCARNNSIVCC